jgi:hypothetical protein
VQQGSAGAKIDDGPNELAKPIFPAHSVSKTLVHTHCSWRSLSFSFTEKDRKVRSM